MQKKNISSTRKGDTSRTSSRGQKLASGTDHSKKGSPQRDEDSKSEIKSNHPPRIRRS